MNNKALQSLSLLIKPASGRCNIECEYCFYRRVHDLYKDSSMKMSRNVLELVIKKSLAAGAVHNDICWQGGEPLLMGLDFFRDAVAFQKKYSARGQSIQNTIQTNGLLLNEEWCKFFREENFLVGISLDGPDRIHDHYRVDHDQNGTFERVMHSIELMKEHGVLFNILCLLTDWNIKHPEEVYNFFKSNDFRFLQFINCFEKDGTSGVLKGVSVRGYETGEFYIRIFDSWFKNDFYDISIRFFEDLLMYFVDGAKASCCYRHSCDSYLVVEHNGDCYPCDFFVSEEWEIGNLENDDIVSIMNNPLRGRFASLKADLTEECRECSILSFCMGDCTRFRDLQDGCIKKSEYCSTIRMVYNHVKPFLPEIRNRVSAFRSRQNSAPSVKPGRNDPCICGSGKKFKHCCME